MTDPLKDDLEWEERTGGGKTPKWPTEPTLESVIAEAIHQRGFESVVVVAVAQAVRDLLATHPEAFGLRGNVVEREDGTHHVVYDLPVVRLPDKETSDKHLERLHEDADEYLDKEQEKWIEETPE